MSPQVQIQTERFILRDLGPSDVTERYLEWLGEPEAQKNITATTASLSALMQYVVERTGRTDVLFLGIFDALNGVHIGNIKYEPVNSALGYAIVGVLIGDVAYRGRGVTAEVLRASTAWLKANRQIHQFLLGVWRANHAAVRAYEKCGFVMAESPLLPNRPPEAPAMILNL